MDKPTINKGNRPQDANRGQLVSIVTICYNMANTLNETIEAVAAQSYKNIEHLIIDGASTDNSLDIIKSQKANISKWLSEPDEGIADAFSKGISLATGEIIIIINADDAPHKDFVKTCVTALNKHPDDGFAYGDVIMFDTNFKTENKTRILKGRPNLFSTPLTSMAAAAHPSMAVRKSTYDKVGGFNKKWKYAMDYDWLLRVKTAGIKGTYNPNIKAQMREGGASNTYKNKRDKENRDIAILHKELPFWKANLIYAARITINTIENLENTKHLSWLAKLTKNLKAKILNRKA